MGELLGATHKPDEAMKCADAGEFAALWNERTPEQREALFKTLQTQADTSTSCFMRDHDGYISHLESDVAGLRNQIAVTLEAIATV